MQTNRVVGMRIGSTVDHLHHSSSLNFLYVVMCYVAFALDQRSYHGALVDRGAELVAKPCSLQGAIARTPPEAGASMFLLLETRNPKPHAPCAQGSPSTVVS